MFDHNEHFVSNILAAVQEHSVKKNLIVINFHWTEKITAQLRIWKTFTDLTHLCMKPRVCIESMASTDSAIYICATSSLKVSFFINIVIKSPSMQ